jgi:CyaY protein
MLTDSEFIAAADRTLAAIGEALDAALEASDADIDWSLNDGILEIDCGDGGKVIVNRHVPNREIWVAARSGGFHFRPLDGTWRDTRSDTELAASLGTLLKAQAQLSIALPRLAAPA